MSTDCKSQNFTGVFCSKTDTCNAMAQKIYEWINYQPILLLNVSIHPLEQIEVKQTF